jgi:hypothetical protein
MKITTAAFHVQEVEALLRLIRTLRTTGNIDVSNLSPRDTRLIGSAELKLLNGSVSDVTHHAVRA